MARLPRFFADGEALHVIQRGNNRDPVFGAEPDYLFYLDCLERAASEHALAKIEALAGRRAAPLSKGRPVKNDS